MFTKENFQKWAESLPNDANFDYMDVENCVFATFIRTFEPNCRSCSEHDYFDNKIQHYVSFPEWAIDISLVLGIIERLITKKDILEAINES